MSRRLLTTLLTLVVWVAGVNHCSLRLLLAASDDGAMAVCSHCGSGAPQPAAPGVKACCQELRAQLVDDTAKLPAPRCVLLFEPEYFREPAAVELVAVFALEHEESPPGYFVDEVLQGGLAAHAPPVIG